MTKNITLREVVFSIIEMFGLLRFLKDFISLNWTIFIGSHENLVEWEMQKKELISILRIIIQEKS